MFGFGCDRKRLVQNPSTKKSFALARSADQHHRGWDLSGSFFYDVKNKDASQSSSNGIFKTCQNQHHLDCMLIGQAPTNDVDWSISLLPKGSRFPYSNDSHTPPSLPSAIDRYARRGHLLPCAALASCVAWGRGSDSSTPSTEWSTVDPPKDGVQSKPFFQKCPDQGY